MLPESYFYKSEVRSDYFSKFRDELELLRDEKDDKKNLGNSRLQREYQKQLQRYFDELKEVADKQREEFRKFYHEADEALICVAMYNLINQFKLIKYLRKFDN